jgi:hypothetical protein
MSVNNPRTYGELCASPSETVKLTDMPVRPPLRPSDSQPRVNDDDLDQIIVAFDGKELRGWSYKDDAERRTKMLCAHEYVEGWCDGRDHN